MANQHKHPLRGVRGIPDADWAAFDEATRDMSTDRSAALAQFIRWYIHREEAEHPKRPRRSPERPSSD